MRLSLAAGSFVSFSLRQLEDFRALPHIFTGYVLSMDSAIRTDMWLL
jgi:hypothetical protein